MHDIWLSYFWVTTARETLVSGEERDCGGKNLVCFPPKCERRHRAEIQCFSSTFENTQLAFYLLISQPDTSSWGVMVSLQWEK